MVLGPALRAITAIHEAVRTGPHQTPETAETWGYRGTRTVPILAFLPDVGQDRLKELPRSAAAAIQR